MYDPKHREEEHKNHVASDIFGAFDYARTTPKVREYGF